MKITAFVLALALASQPVAARVISEITFSGIGTIEHVDWWGPPEFMPPAIGSKVGISGSIIFEKPYLGEYSTGYFDISNTPELLPPRHNEITICMLNNQCWQNTYRNNIFNGSSYISLQYGHLTDIYFYIENNEEDMWLWSNVFIGSNFDYYDPVSQITDYVQYQGTWSLQDATISITTVAVPEPANWALMVAGFGMVGGALRIRRRPSIGPVRSHQ